MMNQVWKSLLLGGLLSGAILLLGSNRADRAEGLRNPKALSVDRAIKTLEKEAASSADPAWNEFAEKNPVILFRIMVE